MPERHTDFIFSIIAEELGFVGAAFVILLFAMFIWRGFYIAVHLEDKFKSLTAFGLTAVIGIQAMINIGVAVGALPVTGITFALYQLWRHIVVVYVGNGRLFAQYVPLYEAVNVKHLGKTGAKACEKRKKVVAAAHSF